MCSTFTLIRDYVPPVSHNLRHLETIGDRILCLKMEVYQVEHYVLSDDEIESLVEEAAKVDRTVRVQNVQNEGVVVEYL